jgi:hypothetical protein
MLCQAITRLHVYMPIASAVDTKNCCSGFHLCRNWFQRVRVKRVTINRVIDVDPDHPRATMGMAVVDKNPGGQ